FWRPDQPAGCSTRWKRLPDLPRSRRQRPIPQSSRHSEAKPGRGPRSGDEHQNAAGVNLNPHHTLRWIIEYRDVIRKALWSSSDAALIREAADHFLKVTRQLHRLSLGHN